MFAAQPVQENLIEMMDDSGYHQTGECCDALLLNLLVTAPNFLQGAIAAILLVRPVTHAAEARSACGNRL